MTENTEKLIQFSDTIADLFTKYLDPYHNPLHVQEFTGWSDRFWTGEVVEKCHLKTIDILDSRKLWLLHLNIFPKNGFDMPILGCDIIAGPNKISGAFFDFSPVCTEDHVMCQHFNKEADKFTWKKPRQLPEWAEAIFSDHMMAVGNVRAEETDQFLLATTELICYYLDKMNDESVEMGMPTRPLLNNYCINQKKNDQLHNSIRAMGISDEDKDYYINNILFQEISD
jgi:phycocyanobilin:ferredoxin oxidoreductase